MGCGGWRAQTTEGGTLASPQSWRRCPRGRGWGGRGCASTGSPASRGAPQTRSGRVGRGRVGGWAARRAGRAGEGSGPRGVCVVAQGQRGRLRRRTRTRCTRRVLRWGEAHVTRAGRRGYERADTKHPAPTKNPIVRAHTETPAGPDLGAHTDPSQPRLGTHLGRISLLANVGEVRSERQGDSAHADNVRHGKFRFWARTFCLRSRVGCKSSAVARLRAHNK